MQIILTIKDDERGLGGLIGGKVIPEDEKGNALFSRADWAIEVFKRDILRKIKKYELKIKHDAVNIDMPDDLIEVTYDK